MTVSELIAILQQFDQALPVVIPSSDEFGEGCPVYAAGAAVNVLSVCRHDYSVKRLDDFDKDVTCVEVYS